MFRKAWRTRFIVIGLASAVTAGLAAPIGASAADVAPGQQTSTESWQRTVYPFTVPTDLMSAVSTALTQPWCPPSLTNS